MSKNSLYLMIFNNHANLSHQYYSVKKTHGHGARSVRQIGDSGFVLTQDEKDAILWHMGGKRIEPDKNKRAAFFQTHPLASIINRADGKSISEAKTRHHK